MICGLGRGKLNAMNHAFRHLHLPEIVTASCQDDPVRREALPLHDEGDIAVLLAKHQGSQLLRQQVDVVDLRHGGQWTQRVAVTHGRRLPESHLTQEKANQTFGEKPEAQPKGWLTAHS